MRVNTGGPRIAPSAEADPSSYPKNPKIEQYLAQAIDSFGQMAEYGQKVGVKVTIENHWGLSANPIHMRIIVEEVNNRFCELSPDFGNWGEQVLRPARAERRSALRAHHRARQVLEPLARPRCAARRSHHDEQQLRRRVCSRV